MHILITGGAGFLGSHLAQALVARGHRVRVLDDYSTGSIANLSQIPRVALELAHGSVLDSRAVRESMLDCDAVFHLAARVGVKLLFEDPQRTFHENIEGARTVFSHAAQGSIPVVFASSSEVYCRGLDRPLCEEQARVADIPSRTRFLYGRSKLLAENMLQEFAGSHRIPARAFRFFNMVGPRQSARYGMVLPTFVRQALAGEPITVYGNGLQKRCFASVTEVAAILAQAVPQRPGFDVVNLGNDRATRIVDLAQTVREAAGSRSPLIFVDPRITLGAQFEDFPSRIPRLDRLRALGFFPPCQSLPEIVSCLIPTQARVSKSFA